MRCACDKRVVLLMSYVGLRAQILSLLHSLKSITHRIVFDSVDAFHPCDSGKLHEYNFKFLVPNERDNKSIVPWNPFRIIRSIPRYQYRGSFSSNFGWMDCRRCSASGQLEDHHGKDGFRSGLPVLELVLVRLVLLSSAVNPEF